MGQFATHSCGSSSPVLLAPGAEPGSSGLKTSPGSRVSPGKKNRFFKEQASHSMENSNSITIWFIKFYKYHQLASGFYTFLIVSASVWWLGKILNTLCLWSRIYMWIYPGRSTMVTVGGVKYEPGEGIR